MKEAVADTKGREGGERTPLLSPLLARTTSEGKRTAATAALQAVQRTPTCSSKKYTNVGCGSRPDSPSDLTPEMLDNHHQCLDSFCAYDQFKENPENSYNRFTVTIKALPSYLLVFV